MGVDRNKLQEFFAGDEGLEREFLGLLLDNLRACDLALATALAPAADSAAWTGLYKTLHAAKPGVMMASDDATSQSISAACDALSKSDLQAAMPLVRQLQFQLAELDSDLAAQLRAEGEG
jgi:hypothetical protein